MQKLVLYFYAKICLFYLFNLNFLVKIFSNLILCVSFEIKIGEKIHIKNLLFLSKNVKKHDAEGTIITGRGFVVFIF